MNRLITGVAIIAIVFLALDYWVVKPQLETIENDITSISESISEMRTFDDIVISEKGNAVLFYDDQGDITEGLIVYDSLASKLPGIKVKSIQKKKPQN